MDEKFIAAAVQAAPVFLNKDETIGKATNLIEEARDNGASLVVFPEAFIPAYPYWPKDLGTGPERKLVLDAYTSLYKNSVEIPSADTEKLSQAARKSGVYVVIGVNERDGGTLYNTILYIGKRGELLGRHRKLLSIDSERCVWGMGGARDLAVFDTELGRIGGFFCYEHHLTLAKYAMFSKGEQIHAGLWAGHGFVKPIMDASSREYAFEGQVFVIVASQYVNEEMIPDSFPLKSLTQWDYPGGSAIISPRGQYIAGPLYDQEGIVYAEIDRDAIIRAKAVIDCLGHFSRPDILSLHTAGQNQSPDLPRLSSDEYNELFQTIEGLSERQRLLEEKIDSLIESLSKGSKRGRR